MGDLFTCLSDVTLQSIGTLRWPFSVTNTKITYNYIIGLLPILR